MYSTGIERFGIEPSGLAVTDLKNKEPINVESKSVIISIITIVVFINYYLFNSWFLFNSNPTTKHIPATTITAMINFELDRILESLPPTSIGIGVGMSVLVVGVGLGCGEVEIAGLATSKSILGGFPPLPYSDKMYTITEWLPGFKFSNAVIAR
jgi:hypothetical protein